MLFSKRLDFLSKCDLTSQVEWGFFAACSCQLERRIIGSVKTVSVSRLLSCILFFSPSFRFHRFLFLSSSLVISRSIHTSFSRLPFSQFIFCLKHCLFLFYFFIVVLPLVILPFFLLKAKFLNKKHLDKINWLINKFGVALETSLNFHQLEAILGTKTDKNCAKIF